MAVVVVDVEKGGRKEREERSGGRSKSTNLRAETMTRGGVQETA